MNDLVARYLVAHRWAPAEILARECLALRAKKQPDEWRNFYTMSQLGAALAGPKKYAEAEPMLLAGYEGMKQREARMGPENKPRLTKSIERLVQLYEAWGKPEKAAEWRARLGLTDLPADVFAPP